MMIYIIPVIVFILIFIQGFFANSEMAMVSSNRIRLQFLANQGNRKAMIIQRLINQPDRLFGTTLVGINLATVCATIITKYYFHTYFKWVNEFIVLELLVAIMIEPLVLIWI